MLSKYKSGKVGLLWHQDCDNDNVATKSSHLQESLTAGATAAMCFLSTMYPCLMHMSQCYGCSRETVGCAVPCQRAGLPVTLPPLSFSEQPAHNPNRRCTLVALTCQLPVTMHIAHCTCWKIHSLVLKDDEDELSSAEGE